ncbi:MAG: YHS domain protein, partial [Sphingobacteriales bacterium 24-40-4]
AKGEKVSVDPETYKIVNGKLYLFYNQFFNNTLKDWNKDEVNLMTKANTNWNKFFH